MANTDPLKSVLNDMSSRQQKKNSPNCIFLTFEETFLFTKLKDNFLFKTFYMT
jgi:hypothetical protein